MGLSLGIVGDFFAVWVVKTGCLIVAVVEDVTVRCAVGRSIAGLGTIVGACMGSGGDGESSSDNV